MLLGDIRSSGVEVNVTDTFAKSSADPKTLTFFFATIN